MAKSLPLSGTYVLMHNMIQDGYKHKDYLQSRRTRSTSQLHIDSPRIRFE